MFLVFIFVLAIFGSINLYPLGIVNYFSCDSTHIVQTSDCCSDIAAKHGIKVNFLKWKNKHLDCDNLRPGTKLCVDKWL